MLYVPIVIFAHQSIIYTITVAVMPTCQIYEDLTRVDNAIFKKNPRILYKKFHEL